ncbi:uncharacterized protein LOC142986407 [Anticarsia gemmatalis]|uniref:uncharacterized protein LOC142986407 n=1 Tax=Anticarsia gemmatalis TaxID=129554 RepID=UPI003F772E07
MNMRYCAVLRCILYMLVWIILLSPCDAQYYRKQTVDYLYAKVNVLQQELLKDAIQKLKLIEPVRQMYYKSTLFQLGQEVFDIKRKIREMSLLVNATMEGPLKDDDEWYPHYIKDDPNLTQDIKNLARLQAMKREVEMKVQILDEYFKSLTPRRSQIHQEMTDVDPHTRRSGGGGLVAPNLPNSTKWGEAYDRLELRPKSNRKPNYKKWTTGYM